MLSHKTEWLFFVTDTNRRSSLDSDEIKRAQDGSNIAVVFNTSNAQNEECKVKLNFKIVHTNISKSYFRRD